MTVVVAIASAGRRETLSQLLLTIGEQTRVPDQVVVCPATPADLDETALASLPITTSIVRSEKPGLPAQRNAILRSLPEDSIVLFLDDDFLMEAFYLEHLETIFHNTPDMAMLTGDVLADGSKTLGISFEEARTIIADAPPLRPENLDVVYNCYGCNMALRLSIARRHSLEFDENLPLYGWQEDTDFSRQMARFGRILKTSSCRGVHLAVKKGRTPGRRLGYSQIANPIYLYRKGTLNARKVLVQMSRNMLANLAGGVAPTPWVDHKGRLIGNMLAIRDLLSGQLDPARILSL